MFKKIKKGLTYAILDKKIFEFSILCNFFVINKERKSILLKNKMNAFKIPLLSLKPEHS